MSPGSTVGQVVDERVAEVEVGAVRLVGQLAQLRVALALGRRSTGSAGCLLARAVFFSLAAAVALACEVVVGALDRALDELAVERAVDDDRPAALELDQHAGGARLVDVRRR